MRRYKCIKSFWVENYDGDGFHVENSATEIKEGKVYELDESGSTIVGGEVHLDAVDDSSWIEITKEDLEEYFEIVVERMTKQEFIKYFAHFMTELDLNETFDSHFEELGHMNVHQIENWLKGVLGVKKEPIRCRRNDWIIDILHDEEFGNEWNSEKGKEFRKTIVEILDKLPCAACRKCKWYFESECRGNDEACEDYIEA